MSEDETRSESADQVGEGHLRDLIAAYETRLTEIADLAARVRHEINNPLTGLLGQAQLLLREDLSDTSRRRVKTIEQLAGRIRDTVAELRDVQRPNSTTATLNTATAITGNEEHRSEAPLNHP